MRDGHIEHILGFVHDQAVGPGQAIHQEVHGLAVGAQAEHAASWVLQGALTLIGEVQVTVGCEEQVVQALQSFTLHVLQVRPDGAGFGIQKHQPVQVIGNEDAPVPMDFQAVGLAFVADDDLKVACRVHAQDAPMRQVHAPQIAGPIEGRPLQEGVHLHVARGQPGRGLFGQVQGFGQPGEYLGAHGFSGRIHGGSFQDCG
ncbi:hypothetical protein D3C87_1172970 [compost metagenome]